MLCRPKRYYESNSCKDVWANVPDIDVPLPIIEVLSISFLFDGYIHLKSNLLVEMPILLEISGLPKKDTAHQRRAPPGLDNVV